MVPSTPPPVLLLQPYSLLVFDSSQHRHSEELRFLVVHTPAIVDLG